MEIEIIIEKPDFKILIEKFLINNLLGSSIKIGITILEKESSRNTQLVRDSSFFKIQVSQGFVMEHYANQTGDYNKLLNEFQNIFQIISKNTDEIIQQMHSFSSVSILYKFKNLILHFPFNFLGENYIAAFENALKLIFLLNRNLTPNIEKQLIKTFDEGKGQRIFSFKKNKWEIVDPLILITKDLNDKFREKKDSRIKKPHIVVNEDNIFEYFVFETNWILVFDGLETMMAQPNDVSIYSNIAEKNLQGAETFYKDIILPRHIYYHGSFPSEAEQKDYFDYFELIIQAIIFSYTALEAFANICIPINYKYTVYKNDIKTIYSKQAIERNFSLRDKFKIILPEILEMSDVTKSKWWNTFIELENLRDEIIHSKLSKSEDRYSSLLKKGVFKLIRNHKLVIEFYGNFIFQNKKILLEEYPYNISFDEVYPGIMTAKNYDETYREMHNIKM
jgi:hypothetical protein